jgi:hypothetical protein
MRLTVLLVVSFAVPGLAQESGEGLQRKLELPAHRSLMSQVAGNEVNPFETDGCSGGLSTSWRVVADLFPDFAEIHEDIPPWETCCVTHDRAYHVAGRATDADQSFDARLAADAALKSCVIAEGRKRREELAARYDVSADLIDRAYAAIADSMYTAVRFGGGPCSALPWRWGYGFPNCFPGVLR